MTSDSGQQSKRPRFQQPAEWDAHRACWLAWPCHENLWQEDLPQARREFKALCQTIADVDPATGHARGESLEILIADPSQLGSAKEALAGLPVKFHQIPFGDIWVRDTGPIFTRDLEKNRLIAESFYFNGWGEKYVLLGDREVSGRLAHASTLHTELHPFVMEGGSLEPDGQGTCITTRQCLLNPNRNPGVNQARIEELLRDSLGYEKILWLGDGLLNDHTDGHIDTLARFAAPGVVLCMKATDKNDPNTEIMAKIAADLNSFTDARGRRLKVIEVPSPGLVLDEEGEIMPASYMNFYIANTTVAVPTYGSPHDAAAVAKIAECFPGRRTVGLSAKAILTGGGAFHCITQQEPVDVKGTRS